MTRDTSRAIVRIETDFGAIRVAIATTEAPITATNFLAYIEDGLYDGGFFHRTVRLDNQSNENLKKERIGAGIDPNANRDQLPNDEIAIEVIQGGINPDRSHDLGDPIPLERTSETGLSHMEGTISMARLTPDSAVSDFFICINEQPALDFGGMRNPDGQGFAAFGHVIEGMDIARQIQAQPSDGQTLDPLVVIRKMTREA